MLIKVPVIGFAAWLVQETCILKPICILKFSKAAIEREQCQTKEQREPNDARVNLAESRLSSRNSSLFEHCRNDGAASGEPSLLGLSRVVTELDEINVSRLDRRSILDRRTTWDKISENIGVKSYPLGFIFHRSEN